MKILKNIAFVFLLSLVFNHSSLIYASEYVLPYPSYMPGNTLYRISRIADRLKSYWYWGSIAHIKYHLGLSDKYLVEAKTLFEYKQYLLAADALSRSDKELTSIPALLQRGENEGKDMGQLRLLVRGGMGVHMAVITTLKSQLPKEFIWKPEKVSGTTIHIDEILTSSHEIREQVSDEVTGL